MRSFVAAALVLLVQNVRGQCTSEQAKADVDSDGDVDVGDLLGLLAAFGASSCDSSGGGGGDCTADTITFSEEVCTACNAACEGDSQPTHTLSTAAAAFPFSGIGDLDVTGNFKYAVNVGGNAADVGGLSFTSDTGTAGVTVSAASHIASWGGRNDFGSDDGLEDVLQSIRWSGYPGPVTTILDVDVGTEYKLQMLSSEKCCTRGWDIYVGDGGDNDELVVENFSSQEIEGGINSLSTGAAFSFDFVAKQSSITITQIGNGGWADNNPILAGFTLEEDPASSPPPPHPVSTAIEVGSFSSAADLDFVGTFLYAVNVGGGAATVGDASFTSDTDTAGITVTAQNHIASWGGRNDFGSDDGLEDVLQSIRWSGFPNEVKMELTGLDPGTEYKIQMMFTEKCCTRGWDVWIDGQLAYENFSPQQLEGGINTMGTGAYMSFPVVATAATMTIVHVGNGGWADNNPILDGFTVETDPASSVPPAHTLSTAAAAFPFSGAGDLDVTGTFKYAVNVGGGAASVAGIDFTPDTSTAGVDVQAASHIPSWGGRNNYGDDDGLEDVLQSIRWTAYAGPVIITLSDLAVGTEYKLQVLSSEKCCTRGWDIYVGDGDDLAAGDELIMENFSSQEVEGGINSLSTGAAFSFDFVANSDTVVITQIGNGGWPDNNPILAGFTLEEDPASSPPPPHPVSTAIEVGSFSSAADLDFVGTFLYAVNVGGGAATVGDASFTSDTDTAGITVTAQNHIASWGGRNDFGSDDGLEDVLQSIRWSGFPNEVKMELTGLDLGTEYKIQMMFTEKCCTRGWDVWIDGQLAYENFSPQQLEGGINTMGTGAYMSFDIFATAATMTIVHVGNGGWADNNPILDGFTVETDPASSVPPAHSLSGDVTVASFSAASDLDFSGNFKYAVNVGGGAATVGDASFVADTDASWGSIQAQNHIASWGGRNDFGDDDGLEDVLQSIRWSGYPSSVVMNMEGLTVGSQYKLQMLFTEKCCTRGWDVYIGDGDVTQGETAGDEMIYENFSAQEVEGGINSMGTGAVMTLTFTANTETVVVTHIGNGGFPDNNPILDGFSLESL